MAKKGGGAQKKDKKKSGGGFFVVSKEEKRKLIPPFTMLLAGAVFSIMMIMRGTYELHQFLLRLLLILCFFYVLGGVLKTALDVIDKQNTPPESDEGEVIEKGPEEPEAGEEKPEEGESDNEEEAANE